MTGCQSETKSKPESHLNSEMGDKKEGITVDTTQSKEVELQELKESLKEEDEIVNDYLTEELKPVRENFRRINSTETWTSIENKELWETTEGGEAHFYYQNNTLEKIITRHFGEMFQKLTEYYLLDEELSFVFEKTLQYNRPIYWDSTAMNESDDTEVFDINKSEIVEERSYFIDSKLIHQANNQDCGAPMADDYLEEEQIRISTMFNDLIKKQ